MTSVCFRAPLLVAVLAVACKRSPNPPSPAPSAADSAHPAVSASPSASASVAPVAPPSCAEWTATEREATGSLERWCRQFGPCPENLQQAVDRVPRFFTTVEARGGYRILRSGFLGGRWFIFESERLVGARIWDDVPFGACAERAVTTYTAGVTLPPSEPGASCGVVAGRDYTSGEPCRCSLKVRLPTLENGNQGPLLRTSLECLYEVGVAAHLCQATLEQQREVVASREKDARGHAEIAAEMRRARGSARPSAAEKISLEQSRFRSSERTECGDTVVTSPYQRASAACRYDAAGTLTGLRWGKRYESEGFTACQR